MNALTALPGLPSPDALAGDLATFMEVRKSRNPVHVAWPRALLIELALKTATPPELQKEYGYSDAEWLALRDNPVFLSDLADMCTVVKQEGMSFKLKASLQAEELLTTTWKMIHAPQDDVPPNVKADLIKSTVRWAGLDNKPGENANGGGGMQALAIQINLGSDY